jgi:hypothetical protein
MTVIAFAPKQRQQDGTWQGSELCRMQATFAAELASGEASGWEAAATEAGDPQFYLLGPPPDEACLLSISRLGRVYVLEDGTGHVLFEHCSLERLTERAVAYLRDTKAGVIARALVVWAAVRQTFEEKLEPALAEGEDLLIHFAPQLAAIA